MNEESWFYSHQEQGVCGLSQASRLALGPTQPTIQLAMKLTVHMQLVPKFGPRLLTHLLLHVPSWRTLIKITLIFNPLGLVVNYIRVYHSV
jgi:hypothetical protein